jgi:ribosomal protein L35AE/L33A
MHKNFTMFVGLTECMQACKLDEDNEADCVFAVGLKFIEVPTTVLDAFVFAGLVESRGRHKKAPQKMWINSQEVNAQDKWTFGVSAVLLYGKQKTNGIVVWIRKAHENDDGTLQPFVPLTPEQITAAEQEMIEDYKQMGIPFVMK